METNRKNHVILLLMIICFTNGVFAATMCGSFNCYPNECCADVQLGNVCYSMSTHACVEGRRLCGRGEGVCGTQCYNRNLYSCSNGRLQPIPSSGGSSTGTTAKTSTTGPSTTGSFTTGSSTTGSGSNTCGTLNCHPNQCCADVILGNVCYMASTHACVEGRRLCGQGEGVCGTQCYNKNLYMCSNGQIRPIQSGGSSGSSGISTGAATTGSSTTGGTTTTTSLSGINYNPRREWGVCATLGQIEQDIRILREHTSNIKIFGLAECNNGELILQAIKNTGSNVKVALGMWLDQGHAWEIQQEIEALRRMARTVGLERVSSIVVGSETVYRGDFPVETLIKYIRWVKGNLTELGYPNIPVTTADVIYNYMAHPELIQVVDFVMANQFPYWEGMTVEQATNLLFNTIQQLKNVAGGKRVVIGETGWPTGGDPFGLAQPSLENLRRNLREIVCRAKATGLDYYWFEAFDSPWKDGTKQGGVERYWGLWTANRTLKSGLSLPVQCPA